MRPANQRQSSGWGTRSHSLLIFAWLLSAIGCSRRADDCTLNLTCGTTADDAGTGTGGSDAGTSVCSTKCAKGEYCDKGLRTCVECVDAGNCKEPGAPLCSASHKCVECLSTSNCSSPDRCEPDAGVCVECLGNDDCTSVAKSVCIDGACEACASNDDCRHFANTQVCKEATASDASVCVQCIDDSKCSGHSCNLATNQCTTTTLGSVKTCEPCVSDSECDSTDATSRCVAMNFKGTPVGGYCLRLASAGCTQPYSVSITSVSLSGAASASYCGIDQTVTATSCKALLDLTAATGPKSCISDNDCGLGQGDGLCRTVGTLANRCTIPCNSGSNCLYSAPGNTCVAATPKYCQ